MGPKRPKVRSISVEETWAKELVGAVDLHLDLSGTRVRAGLEGALRDAIRAGRLRTGTRLPSSRALAADLGVARNTVAEVYSQLIAEGWLTARTGSGTSVAPHRAPAPCAPEHPTCRRSRAAPGSRRPARSSPMPPITCSGTPIRAGCRSCEPPWPT